MPRAAQIKAAREAKEVEEAKKVEDAEVKARKARGKKGRLLHLSPYTSSTTHVDPAYKHEAIRKLYDKTINLSKPKAVYDKKRLAERTPAQKAAAQQVQNIIANQQRLNIPQKAQDQLAKANQQNIMQTVQPYLQQSADPLALRQQYMNPYQQQMVASLRDESKQHLLEDILPRVNASFIGGFHSSGRNKFTQKAIDNEQRSLQREISKLLSHGHERASEQGLQHARLKTEEALNKGQLAGSIAGRQKESDIIGAREMQNLNQMAVSQEHLNAQALNQIGGEEQRQKQVELNIPYQKFLEDREKPYLHLSRQAALLGGLPQPGFQTFQTTPPGVDVPPNLYSAGAGGLGIMADLMHPRRARGGPVKIPKRAGGGPVQAPDTSQMQAMAQQFQQPGRDPRWGYLGTLGATMLANNHINPLRALGKGALAGKEAMNSEYAEQDQRAVHAANLMDKINSTRQTQQQMLQEYDLGKERNLLTRRGQDITAGHYADDAAHHRVMEGLAAAKPQKLEREDQKALTDMRKQMSTSLKLKTLLGKLQALGTKIKTGPNAGPIFESDKPFAKNIGAKLMDAPVADVQLYNKIMNQYVSMLEEYRKGNPSLGRLRQLQAGQPSLSLDKNALSEIYSNSDKELDHALQEGKFVTQYVKSGKGNAAEAESAFIEMLEGQQQPYLGPEENPPRIPPESPQNPPSITPETKQKMERLAYLEAKEAQ